MKIGKMTYKNKQNVNVNIMLYEYEKEEYKDKLENAHAEKWCWYYKLTKGNIYPRAFCVPGDAPEIHILEKCFAKKTLEGHEIGHLKGEDDTLFGLMSFTFILRGRYD